MADRVTENGRKMITSQEVADIIGMTARTVQSLAKAGILTCEKVNNRNMYDLYTVIREYCDHVAKSNTQKFSSLEEQKLNEEMRLKRSKAETAELELMELKGHMHSADDVEAMTTDLVMTIRSALTAMPGRIAAELAEIEDAAELAERLKSEVAQVLSDLSRYEYDPEEYRKRVRERRGWLTDGREGE